MSCKYHFNWTTDAPCPYCRIAELEQQPHSVGEWHNAADIERIADLEHRLKELQTAYDELRLLADGRLSIKPEYVRGLEQQLARYQSKYHNLLAVAHRDGGQYLAQHGEEKAGEDAITAILTAYHNNDRYQGAVEVEATVGYGSILQLELYPYSAGQRVRVLVMEVE